MAHVSNSFTPPYNQAFDHFLLEIVNIRQHAIQIVSIGANFIGNIGIGQ